jgi:hypothetical protein
MSPLESTTSASLDADDVYLRSSYLENVLEHAFIGDLLRTLWQRRIRNIEILRSAVDAWGYDLVLSSESETRYVQLKSRKQGGKTSGVPVSGKLDDKPGSCVIWMEYDPETLRLGPFYWYADGDIRHMTPAKRTTANAQGEKPIRRDTFILKMADFKRVDDLWELARRLLPTACACPSAKEG